jgi:iron(III) transport system permease protein
VVAAVQGHGTALLGSLRVAALATAVALLLGLPLGAVLARWRLPGRPLLWALVLGPLVVPPYLAAIGWVDAFGPGGAVPRALGLAQDAGPSLLAGGAVYSWPSCGVLLGGAWFPLVALAVWAALRRVPAGQLEAARLVRGAAGERRILLAAALPHALAGGLLVFALTAVEFAVPQLLRIKVLAEDAYLAMAADGKATDALRLGAPLLGLAALSACAAVLGLARPLASGGAPAPRLEPGPRRSVLAWAGCLLALAPGLWIPLGSLTTRLFVSPFPGGAGGSGVARASAVLEEAWRRGAEDAARSVTVGAVAATVALLLALACAWPLRRARWRTGGPVAGGLAALVACPAPVIGVAVILSLNNDLLGWLYDGLGAVVLVDLLRFGPLALAVAWLAFHALPSAQESAARLARRRPFARVALPQAAPSLAVGWLLVYVLSVTEFGASALVSPPGQSVLSVFLVNEAHYGQGAELSGLCALMLGVALLPLLPAVVLGALVGRRPALGRHP